MSATKKLRLYSNDFLKFGFIVDEHDKSRPFCLVCHQSLTNESMKLGRLEKHLRAKHPHLVSRELAYFEALKRRFETRPTVSAMFSSSICALDRGQEASYELSLLIAKVGGSHSDGENLIKPAISKFLQIVRRTDDADVRRMPLSNDTVRRRIDDMGYDVESQLVEKLRTRSFSLQLDESTIRDSESLLLAYVRFIDDDDLREEMLFCESLRGSTTAQDIFEVVQGYLSTKKIPMSNVVSCTADGAPAMMGKRSGCLKLMKDRNPDMLIIHCVVHRENLVAKNLSPKLHEIMHTVIKCINSIKAKPKCERLFKQFCQDRDADHVRLLLHTEVRWLSKGNCLRRFMQLFDPLTEFLAQEEAMDVLGNVDGKAYVSYLADIFERLNVLNLQLQGKKVTIIDAKTKIFGFIKFLELARMNLSAGNFAHFDWLKRCKVTKGVASVISAHLDALVADFNERFSDLRDIVIPRWIEQPFLVDLADVATDYQEEISELQCNQSMETLFRAKGSYGWLTESMRNSYPRTSLCASETLIHFPSSYLVECGFSAVNHLVNEKRNRLEITIRGDLRLKLTNISPRIASLCEERVANASH